MLDPLDGRGTADESIGRLAGLVEIDTKVGHWEVGDVWINRFEFFDLLGRERVGECFNVVLQVADFPTAD